MLVRAAVVGSAVGFTFVAVAYGVARAVADRFRR